MTVYKDCQKEGLENNHESHIDTSNERFARTTTFSNLTSEQKLRRHLGSGGECTLAHRARTVSDTHSRSQHMDIKGKRLKSDSGKDFLTYSSSLPGRSSLINEDTGQDRVLIDDDGKNIN